jgi:four helix bundle protein
LNTFRTFELASDFYQQVATLKLNGHLREQLLRASSSIALNLAEGNAKSSVKEKKRFYQIAYGSRKECQAIFKICRVEQKNILNNADHLGVCLYKLTKAELTVDAKQGRREKCE